MHDYLQEFGFVEFDLSEFYGAHNSYLSVTLPKGLYDLQTLLLSASDRVFQFVPNFTKIHLVRNGLTKLYENLP